MLRLYQEVDLTFISSYFLIYFIPTYLNIIDIINLHLFFGHFNAFNPFYYSH